MIEDQAEEDSSDEEIEKKPVIASDNDEDEDVLPAAGVDGYEEDGFVVTEPVEEEGARSEGDDETLTILTVLLY